MLGPRRPSLDRSAGGGGGGGAGGVAAAAAAAAAAGLLAARLNALRSPSPLALLASFRLDSQGAPRPRLLLALAGRARARQQRLRPRLAAAGARRHHGEGRGVPGALHPEPCRARLRGQPGGRVPAPGIGL